MNRLKNFFLVSLIVISCSGCNQYFVSTTPENVYYGAYNRRDFIQGDVTLFKKNSDLVCNGVLYLNAPSRGITFKNDRVDAKMKLGCNDGKIIDSAWRLKKATFNDGWGEGVDQFNHKYAFKTISKSEFKKVADNNKKLLFPNDKNKSLLKY